MMTSNPFSAIGPGGHARAVPTDSSGELWRVALTTDEGSPTYYTSRAEAVQAARILAGTVTLR